MTGVSWQWFFLSKMIWFGKGCCVVLVVDSNFNTVTWTRSCCFRGFKCSLSSHLLKFSGFKFFEFHVLNSFGFNYLFKKKKVFKGVFKRFCVVTSESRPPDSRTVTHVVRKVYFTDDVAMWGPQMMWHSAPADVAMWAPLLTMQVSSLSSPNTQHCNVLHL